MENDIKPEEIAGLCDVFYIGGTKVGAFIGEAVVFTKKAPAHFLTQIKRNGALLAKGWLIGVQFETLFTENLYFKISENAIKQAEKLNALLLSKGFTLSWNSPTNQIFVTVSKEEYLKLSEKVRVSFWEETEDGDVIVRFASSFATTDEDIENLSKVL